MFPFSAKHFRNIGHLTSGFGNFRVICNSLVFTPGCFIEAQTWRNLSAMGEARRYKVVISQALEGGIFFHYSNQY